MRPAFLQTFRSSKKNPIDLQDLKCQIASALLIAGLFAEGQITIKELRAQHAIIAKMLKAFSAPVHRQGLTLKTGINRNLRATSLSIVSDFFPQPPSSS